MYTWIIRINLTWVITWGSNICLVDGVREGVKKTRLLGDMCPISGKLDFLGDIRGVDALPYRVQKWKFKMLNLRPLGPRGGGGL